MSAEGLMGPFAAITDPAAGTAGLVYQRYLWSDCGLGSGFVGQKSLLRPVGGGDRQSECARKRSRQTRQLLASSVARLYWDWQARAAVEVSTQIKFNRTISSVPIASCISAGSPPLWKVSEPTSIASKTERAVAEVHGKMKAHRGASERVRAFSPPAGAHGMPYRRFEASLPSALGVWALLARRPDLQAALVYRSVNERGRCRQSGVLS